MASRICNVNSHVERSLFGKCAIVCACFFATAMCVDSKADDVYANVWLWMRGMGADANGNGILDSGELRDSMNKDRKSVV